MNCRHCAAPIIATGPGVEDGIGPVYFAHVRPGDSRLIRCVGTPVYGYDAMPDDGMPCHCWACDTLGRIVPPSPRLG